MADGVGLASIDLTKLAPEALVLCEITPNNGHGLFKVTQGPDFGTNRKIFTVSKSSKKQIY